MKMMLRDYLTPLKRNEKDSNFQIVLQLEENKGNLNFFDSLFKESNIGEVLERTFAVLVDSEPKAFIKSFIPLQYLNHEKIQVKKDKDIEKIIDITNNVRKIKKEILLTWPTAEEAQYLKLIGDTRVFVQKSFFLSSKGNIIRYEEEISIPELFEFEG